MVFSLADLEASRGVVIRPRVDDFTKLNGITTGWSPTEQPIEGVRNKEPRLREVVTVWVQAAVKSTRRYPVTMAVGALVAGIFLGRASKRCL